MTRVQRSMTWLTCLSLVGLLLGCGGTNTPSSPKPSGGPPVGPTAGPPSGPPAGPPGGPPGQGEFDTESGPHTAGKKVVVAAGCFRCHTINGVRGPVGGGPMGGPPPGPGGPGGPGGPPGAGGPGGP